jgi:hypothetical protein
VTEPAPSATGSAVLSVEFCGEWFTVDPAQRFRIGREGDLVVDDNPYLHRRFLEITFGRGLWWLTNVGATIPATVSDFEGRVQAQISPSASLPIVFPVSAIRFTAGPTLYEVALHLSDPPYAEPSAEQPASPETTLGRVSLTPDQKLLIVALAERALSRGTTGATSLPSSSQAAARLGWPMTKFNRKLDNVCEKLGRAGVQGLHGDSGKLASARRARLVEYAIAVRLVEPEDVQLLP